MAKQAILPLYLLLCMLIGGSAQGIWANAALQGLAIAILVWAALTPDPQPSSRAARQLLWLVGLLALLILFQLVPLPPALWSALPGRGYVVDGFAMLGMPRPWMPLSLAPHDSLATAMTLLPPLAVLVGMLRLRSWSATWMLAAIILGARGVNPARDPAGHRRRRVLVFLSDHQPRRGGRRLRQRQPFRHPPSGVSAGAGRARGGQMAVGRKQAGTFVGERIGRRRRRGAAARDPGQRIGGRAPARPPGRRRLGAAGAAPAAPAGAAGTCGHRPPPLHCGRSRS